MAYGFAELVIGAFCMFVPLTFASLANVYVDAVARSPGSLAQLSLLRAAVAVVVVLIPAGGMGATLPLLARFVQSESEQPQWKRSSETRKSPWNRPQKGGTGVIRSRILVSRRAA